MRINREDFLQVLESVQGGTTMKDTVEQSSCFAFKDNQVLTFSKELACVHQCKMDFECAVQAMPLLEILRNLDEETLEVELKKNKFMVYGDGGRKTAIPMEEKVALPINLVEEPNKWHVLPEDFSEAVKLVHQVAGNDEKKFAMTCIHISSGFIEALDLLQIARYKIDLEIPDKENILVQRKTIRHMIELGMHKFSICPAWLHFKNKNGLRMSCRRYDMYFPSDKMTEILKKKGSPTNLPKGLVDAVNRAAIFSKFGESDVVMVTLKSGRVEIKGRGAKGYHIEPKKVSYEGDEISFMITPGIFSEMIRKHNDCFVSKDMLKVKSGKLTYLCSLRNVSEKEREKTKKKGSK